MFEKLVFGTLDLIPAFGENVHDSTEKSNKMPKIAKNIFWKVLEYINR